ncbi:MAG: DUF411 domain-containing protein [Gammaproteobacteria bacterium]
MKKAWASEVGLWLAMSWAWTGVALAQEVTVYKSPTCGCCTKWVKHMEASGFTVDARDVPDVNPYKQNLGLPLGLGSCHTAVVDGYLIEGHVPAEDIRRLLQEQIEAKGLAVPGMPMGSPGMEGPRKDRYEVLLIDKEGQTSVYARH